MRCSISERNGSRARHRKYRELAITECIGERCEQLHLVSLRSRRNVAIAQAGARAVVAHDTKAVRETREKTAKTRMLPITLDVTDPPCGAKDERPFADRGIGDPGAARIPKESNSLLCRHLILHPGFHAILTTISSPFQARPGYPSKLDKVGAAASSRPSFADRHLPCTVDVGGNS